MESLQQNTIKDFFDSIRNKHDAMLIAACEKKGLIMSIETANQYRVLEVLNKPYCILEHVPSGTHICQYSKDPTYTFEENKVTSEWNFKEL